MQNATSHSCHTIADYLRFVKLVMAEDMLLNGWKLSFGEGLLGGSDDEVEVDETKAGKCKYGKGHPVAGVWILVAVSWKTKRFVAEPVRCRCKMVIKWFLDRYVNKTSVLITDGWSSYRAKGVGDSFRKHRWVNHKKQFKNKDGTYSNTVEGNSLAIKRVTCRSDWRFDSIMVPLLSAVWRRNHEGEFWSAFWTAASAVRYPHYPFFWKSSHNSCTLIADHLDSLNRPPQCDYAQKKA
uniref:ISXO2-like transposase domain-containing protein n=1 Tax=Chromera velia CCMP2878 TaxID=1169474 RepID=A0A0G4EZ59_9ALVE|eukprot:Cvel_14352.t1-p1 / transcript=Cvel_14352.t1 / gene=Cvel_14352 / organism=Chromera_velia_CCMP2878 / gene_product=hypothetical protein / transcript_product=hypothetical protein / location=Cvel_scaffold1017:48623-50055(-) / protein_length=237 / sequence_SO=supercontig / SO=protein_coding / is_pseudo=false